MNSLAASLAGISLSVLITACSGVRPASLGVKDGKLSPCPSSPNCVSSQSADPGHRIEPLRFSTPVELAAANLKNILLGMNRVRIADEHDSYLHVEFRSAVFRFVDDVEFYFDAATGNVQVRSASRLGYSDLGVNRSRIEQIRERWRAAGNEAATRP